MQTAITNTHSREAAGIRNQSFWEMLAFNYFSVITIAITTGSIFGGVATMFILQNDAPTWQLVLCAMLSMGNNVAAIGSAPVKWIAGMFSMAMIVNTLLILANAF